MIDVQCPQCGKHNRFSSQSGGKSTACSKCGAHLAVPADDEDRRRIADPDDDEGEYRLDPGEEPEKPRPQPKNQAKKRKAKKRAAAGDEDESVQWSAVDGGHQLGPCKEVFSAGTPALRIAAVTCVILAALGMTSCVLSMLMTLPGAVSLVLFLLIPVGLAGLLMCMNFLTLKVELRAGGLVHMHRGQERIIPWEEIESVSQAITEVRKDGVLTASFQYTVELRDHSKFIYGSNRFREVDRLGNTIIDRTSTRILPQVRLKYEHGERVDFGRLGVNKKGLNYAKQVLKWGEVSGVRVSEGYITVCRDGTWERWCNIPAAAVPNLQVFLAFAQEIIG